jgi:hypothetical protein
MVQFDLKFQTKSNYLSQIIAHSKSINQLSFKSELDKNSRIKLIFFIHEVIKFTNYLIISNYRIAL